MPWSTQEILETLRMTEVEHLDIRTTTLGISLRDCIATTADETRDRIYKKIHSLGADLVRVGQELESETGIKIANKRISVTPISLVGEKFSEGEFVQIAHTLDDVAGDLNIDFIAGYTALVQKGCTPGDCRLIHSIPEAIGSCERVCGSVNVASTRAGMNMAVIQELGGIIKSLAEKTAGKGAIGCAKFVVFSNAVEDNPFVAGAFHGISEPEAVINIGVSGPGVVLDVVRNMPEADMGDLAEAIKRTAFRVTRAGEYIGRRVAERLGIKFGIVDLSLAPTPAEGDSVADILQAMGLEEVGAHGTTAALAILTDAVKKGGLMASSYVGGLSGAFIPVSEDAGMIRAVTAGALTLDKLEAMTSVCSVGLDMIAIPGDTAPETISAIIADEAAIGMINGKTTAVRIIPVPGKKVGDMVNYGGLLGSAPVMPVNQFSSVKFINRKGRAPAPVQSFKN